MRSMSSLLQLGAGVAVAGVVAAGATAMTAAGVTLSGTAADKWVGGTAVQTVTGTNISAIAYTPLTGDTSNTKIQQVDITVIDPATATLTRTMTIKLIGGTYGSAGGTTTADRLLCDDGAGTHTSTWNAGTSTATLTIDAGTTSNVTCVPDNATPDATGAYYSGMTSLAVGVS